MGAPTRRIPGGYTRPQYAAHLADAAHQAQASERTEAA